MSSVRRTRRSFGSYTRRSFGKELVFVLLAAAFCVPLYLVLTISLKTTAGAYQEPLGIPFANPNWESYSTAATNPNVGQVTLLESLVNSTIITIGSVCLLILFGGFTAYVIGRRPSKLSTGAYMMFVGGIILPFQLGIVPLYVLMRQLGLVGTHLGMILLYTGLFMPITVLLYTGFVRTLPKDYEEAAQVDGASLFRTFFRIVLPLLIPVTGTVAVITGLAVWNDFLLQLIFLSGTDRSTVVVTLYSLASQATQPWNEIFAGVAISVAPIILFYLFTQRTMIKGMSGGIRG